MMRPGFRQLAQWRLKCKLSLDHGHLLSNLACLNRKMSRLEKWLILRWGNKKIKRLIKKGEPIIIDFFGLPISKYWNRFAIKVLVKSPEEERIARLTERNNFTTEQTKNVNVVATDIVNYENVEFDLVIKNDYETDVKILAVELFELISRKSPQTS